MKQLAFAIGITVLTLTANQCLAQAKPAAEITKASAAAHSVQKININKATAEQLQAIPGLGQKKAQAVLDYIAEHGSITEASQLTKVKGIGEKLAAKIAPYVNYN